MPVTTRRHVQSSIPFQCRKTRNGSRTPDNTVLMKHSLKTSTEHLKPCKIMSDTSTPKRRPSEAVRSSPDRNLTCSSQLESLSANCQSTSPRKRALLQEVSTNEERPLSPCCSPRKVKKENQPVCEDHSGDSPKSCRHVSLCAGLGDCIALKSSRTPKMSPMKPVANQTLGTTSPGKTSKHTHQDSPITHVAKTALHPVSPANTRKNTHQDLATAMTPSRRIQSPGKTCMPLFLRQVQGECYKKTKKALHTALPDRLLCRDKELESMTSFLKGHLTKVQAGSLYISGAPGTGKTACLSHVLNMHKKLLSKHQVMFVNCMSVRHSQGIYGKIWEELDGVKQGKSSAQDASKKLQKAFTSTGPMVVLILDEIDHLDSKGQEVLYTMFEWPALPKSRLILIGVANALDLTDRILPRLQARPKCKPQLLHFPPYSKEQISVILLDRVHNGSGDIVDPMAVQLCARKVAAVAGDIRKALDVCRRAVEIVECDVKSQLQFGSKSPVKTEDTAASIEPGLKRVGIKQVSSVIAEVYGSRMNANCSQSQTFPLQQKLMICTVLLMVRGGRVKEITIGKCHETYSRVCKDRQVPAVDQSEFLSLCQLVESRGVVGLKYSKNTRMTKISLKMNEHEVETALQDKVLLSSILQEANHLKK